MRRLLAIVLLALLPLQFSWAAVASYCGHETQASADHLGHHEHQHHADSDADMQVTAAATADTPGDKPPGAMDLDCGHCHAYCSVLPTPAPGLPGTLSTARPGASVDAMAAAHAAARPERPQWPPLA